MTRRATHPAGTVTRITVQSELLEGNLLDDPTERVIDVYVPHGHDGAGLPLLVDLAGYTGSGLSHSAWKNFGENLPERLDRLIGDGALPPVVVSGLPNMTPIFMRIWLMKITVEFDLETVPVSLRSAWLIRRACRPTW